MATQHTHTHRLRIAAAMLMGAGVGSRICGQERTIRAGSAAGTERWIVMLRGRSFSLRDRLAAIRAEPDHNRRLALIGQLGELTRADQDEFSQFAAGLGVPVVERFWNLNACVVEIAPTRVGVLRGHRHVLDLYPDEARHSGTITARIHERASRANPAKVPLDTASSPANGTDAANHDVATAHSLIGRGGNAIVALFDSGVDLDQNGAGTAPDPNVHDALRGPGGQSRVVASVLIGTIECNTTSSTPPVDPYCSLGAVYPDARHGMGVAGIAAGTADPAGIHFPAGHAPEARLLSYAVTWPGPQLSAVWPTYQTTVEAAIQQLEQFILLNPTKKVHVLTSSYEGWPEPDNPTQLGLDRLEREHDVLVIMLAGNEGDGTVLSHGFTNGLSVGNVHKFHEAAGRYPHRLTSRGPLVGDPDRYFPDVCASGASGSGTVAVTSMEQTDPQIIMPLTDYVWVNPGCPRLSSPPFPLGMYNYNAQGTSMSAPQVAGAAALYRSYLATATAQETRAALLLCSIDPSLEGSWYGIDDHTYTGRNTVGVGYVRDNLLARYARRFDNALAQSVTLTTQAPTVDIAYSGLTVDQHYAVAVAWPRPIPDDAVTYPWANVDLEIRSPGGTVLLARSDALRNTYEKLVFRATGTSALVRLIGTELLGQSVPVFVAARGIGGDGSIESRRSIPGYVARIAQEPACSASVANQQITRVLPSPFKDAYGSVGVTNSLSPLTSAEAHRGFIIADNGGSRPMGMVFREDMTDGAPYTVRALALRAWKPLPSCTTTITFNAIYMAMGSAGSQPPPISSTGMQLVATNVQVPVLASEWTARRPDTWPIIVPLDTPFNVLGGLSLQIWMNTSSSPPCTFEVDGTFDPSGNANPPWAEYASSVGPTYYDGHVPMLGIIEVGQLDSPPELLAYGFPVIGRHLLFQVRQASGGSPTWVVLGASNPNGLFGSCRVLTSADLGTVGPVTTAPLGHANLLYQMPNMSSLLHQHVFAQAVVQAGPDLRYSNGLRLTIGGVMP